MAKKKVKERYCPECGEKLKPSDKYCMHCGYSFEERKKSKPKIIPILISIIIFIILWIIVRLLTGKPILPDLSIIGKLFNPAG